ncbi:MAG TPA: hypothetical protein VGI10_14550 [Polyangiaceae bacterium]|jgi:hypothetical protein
MLGRKEWRIRTPFSEVVVRLASLGSDDAGGADAVAVLGELLFEFQNENPAVVRPLLEVHQALSGLGARAVPPPGLSSTLARSVERELRSALGSGRLTVALKPRRDAPVRAPGEEVARLGPQPIVEEQTTFIGVRVLDSEGNPVTGEAVRIELPDGSVRNVRTGADGAIFLDSLNPGGPATVTLSERFDPGDAEPPPDPDSYEAVFVDETGQAIEGVEVVFSHSTQDISQITDGDGVAKITSHEPVTVRFADLSSVSEALTPRWAEARALNIPEGDDVSVFGINNAGDAISLAAGARSTIVITPPTGVLSVELWDKTGRVPHANRDYSIDGPMQFSGTTDDQGRLFHDNVFPGDYALTLTLQFFEGEDQVTDTYKTPLIVQSP